MDRVACQRALNHYVLSQISEEIRGVLRISEEMGGKIHLKYMSEAIKYPLIISVFVKT